MTNELANYGRRDEVRELADRIKMMMPGGQNYSPAEALTLAQIGVAHDLDPFNGEVWLIKDDKSGKVYGALVGIKGHRKHAKNQANYWGIGNNGGFDRVTDEKKLAEYDATKDDIVYEYRIMDDKTITAYTEKIKSMIDMGFSIEQVHQMFGPPPVTIGVGVYKNGERTKMKPSQCAMFRAEKDALKRRFDVQFRIQIDGQELLVKPNGNDEEPDYEEIEAEYTELDEPRDEDEIIAELGYEMDEPALAGWSAETIEAVMATGAFQHEKHAINALNKSDLNGSCDPDLAVKWAKGYRARRDIGKDSDTAAAETNEVLAEYMAKAAASPTSE